MKLVIEYRMLNTYHFEIDPVKEGHLEEDATMKEKIEWVNSFMEGSPDDIIKNDGIKPIDHDVEYEVTKWDIKE